VEVTVSGPSFAGADMDVASKIVRFEPGQTTATFSTQVYEDALYEGNEVFKFELVSAAGAQIDLSNPDYRSFYGYIIDNEVLGGNEVPTDILLVGHTTLENSASGGWVGQFFAADPNAGDTHTYALLNSAGGRFAISGNTLLVANGALLDFEQAQSHAVVVRATDQNGAFVDQSFTIGVVDETSESTAGTIGNDSFVGGSGADSLSGGAGADYLSTGAGKDVLNGGAGNDKLRGGLGIDKLTGGTGKDVFIFEDKETGASKTTADTILDFRGKLGDKLDLRLVDANIKARGDQAFTFTGEAALTKAGQIRYEQTKTDTWVYLNTDADTAAEAVIRLKGVFDLSKGWFMV
jgi:Ca2+-binding RTX toxin-like protein